MYWIQLSAIIVSGISLGVADALIKKIGLSGNFLSAIFNPWMIGVLALYFAQILLFVYIFISKWDLGMAGVFTAVFYSLTVVLIGLLFFGENISMVKWLGIIFAIIGVILMNIGK
ncbi:hypothetical protein J4479_04525 [Candidatus Woesearchaeota archaeon]|nr:hypothetical protein [Candidatus Woesearchaeota archaeon]